MKKDLSPMIVLPATCLLLLSIPAGPFVHDAAAQPDNAQIRSQKETAPHRTAQRGQSRQRRQVDVERANRHLLSPMGSAANVRRGWYRQNLSQPVVQGGGHHRGRRGGHYGYGYGYGYGVPYVVYVDPTPREPYVPEDQPQRSYEPPPIYVVQPQAAPASPPPQQPSSTPTWQPSAPAAAEEPAPPRRPRSTEPQSVSISIRPADALVYLDGELLGTADSLSLLDLRPGVYVLEVEHAEFASQRLVFGVDEEPLSVAVDLLADRPSRRSRVK